MKKHTRNFGVPSAKKPNLPRLDILKGKQTMPRTLGKVVINHGKVLSPAAELFDAGGSKAAIAYLGSRSKFVVLAPKIKAQVLYFERAAKRLAAFHAQRGFLRAAEAEKKAA